MSYVKTNWQDRSVEKPLTYTLTDNGDGTTTLVPAEGTIVAAGTALNAVNLNHEEQGISDAHAMASIYMYKNIGGAL